MNKKRNASASLIQCESAPRAGGMGLIRLELNIAIIAVLVVSTCLQLVHCQVDKTVEDDASGEEVVDAVIAKIGSMFGKDFDFFKRLAYVDTRFGATSKSANFAGGIWKVSEAMFEKTQVKTDLNALYGSIYKSFGIKWRKDVEWTDLRKPLYSALALHLYLYTKDSSTLQRGFPQTIEDQAKYRSTYLIGGNRNVQRDSEQDFTRLVKTMEGLEKKCNAKVDFVVVLDGSGSVGKPDFKKSLDFVARLFAMNSLDTARLGFIVYSDSVETYLNLTRKKTAQEIPIIVQGARYPKGLTNTNDAIKAGVSLFNSSVLRPGVPKVMAVFTDGGSNSGGHHGNGGVPDIAQARSQGITTYAVGIGSSTKQSELLEIAQYHADRVFSLKNFDALLEFFRNLHTQTCAESQTPSVGQNTVDTLNRDDHRLYRFQWGRGRPPKSFRITLKTTRGSIEAYYGSSGGINRAWNEGQLQVGTTIVEHPDLYKGVLIHCTSSGARKRNKGSSVPIFYMVNARGTEKRFWAGQLEFSTPPESCRNEHIHLQPKLFGRSPYEKRLWLSLYGSKLFDLGSIFIWAIVQTATENVNVHPIFRGFLSPAASYYMIISGIG